MTDSEALDVIKAYRTKLANSASNLLNDDITAFDMAIAAMVRCNNDDKEEGYWVIDGPESEGTWWFTWCHCSKCGTRETTLSMYVTHRSHCSGCGSKMKRLPLNGGVDDHGI